MGLAARPSMGIFQDLRFALRVLWKKRLFSAFVIATLALGIGANSAMFSIVHSVILQPLDLPDIDRLAVVQQIGPRQHQWENQLSPRGILDLQEESTRFQALVAWQWWDASLTGDGEPEQVVSFLVGRGFFQTLGVKPLLGRAFADEEVNGKTENVAILSHGLWMRRYAGDRGVVGRSVEFNGKPYTIVGVMPDKVLFPVPAEMWAPLTFSAAELGDRRSRYIGAIGRLKEGVSLDEASAELRGIGERWAATYPVTDGGHHLRVVSAVRGVTGELTRGFTLTLMGAALFVLLIAAANVANLFLAHALSRRRELVVRTALGAGRGRIVRQLLVESALLGLAGGGLSLLLADWVLGLIKGSLSPRTTRFVAGWNEMGVDSTVLGVTLAAGVLVGLLFGVLPSLQASRVDLGAALKDGDRASTTGVRGQRLRSTLAVAQVALALALLVGAGGLVEAFRRMARPDPGIDSAKVLVARTQLNATRYPKPPDMLEYERQALDALSAVPGVEAAAVASAVPWGELGGRRLIEREGAPPDEELLLDVRGVSPSYLPLLRVPLLEGRHLSSLDTRDAQPVAVISRQAAERLWAGEPPLGKRFRWKASGDEAASPWITVVGVVGEVPKSSEMPAPPPTLFLTRAQNPTRAFYFAVRAAGDPALLAGAVTGALHGVDFNQPLIDVLTLEELLWQQVSGIRLGSSTMAVFALLALVLAAIGIYGVASTLVLTRTHEIGVRLALGAQRRDVMRLVLGRGLVLTAVGLAIGLALAVGLSRVMASALEGHLVYDGAALFIIVTAAVTGVSLLGTYLPARRAARVDPMIALRHD